MKKLLFTLCAALGLYGFSQAQNCAANFSATTSPTSLSVAFHDSSIVTNGGAVSSWTWYFGDSTYSTSQNPTHTYTHSGTFYVCLYVRDTLNGIPCTSHKCDSIRVGVANPPLCSVGFQYTTGPNLGQVNFASTATGYNITYYWTFGDGSTSTSSTPNPTHVYTTAGRYYVCVNIESHDSATGNVNCTNSYCDSIAITSQPVNCQAAFTDSVSNLTASFSSSNTYSGYAIYYYTYGDGGTDSSIHAATTHTYSQAGTYNVCLTFTENNNNFQPICSSTICHSVTVGSTAATCQAAFTDSTTGLTASFSSATSSISRGTSYTIYKWTYGDGLVDSTTGTSRTHTYAQAGTYNVCLTIKEFDSLQHQICTSDICHSVTVTNPTTAGCTAYYSATVTPGSLTVAFHDSSSVPAPGHIGSWAWFFGDNTSSSLQNPTHTFANAGTYYVCLSIRDTVNGVACVNYDCDSIHVGSTTGTSCQAAFTFRDTGLVATFTSTSSLGAGAAYTLYNWNFGDSLTATTSQTHIAHTYAHSGFYNVCLTITEYDSLQHVLCTSTYCKKDTVSNPTNTNCSVHVTYTQGPNAGQVTFTTSATGTNIRYGAFSFGDSTYSTTGAIVQTHTYLHSGRYRFCTYIVSRDSITGVNLCTSQFCDSITINIPNTACHAAFTDTVTGLVANFTSTSSLVSPSRYIVYQWKFGDSTTATTTINTVAHTYLHSGTYNACLYITEYDSLQHVICTSDICHTVTVVGATAGSCHATFTDTSSATSLTVQFTNTSISVPGLVFYTWYFGDSTSSNAVSPSHTYAHSGTYNVCLYLRVYDSLQQHLLCSEHICKQVNVANPNTNGCQAAFRDTVLNNGLVYFSSTSTLTPGAHYTIYNWSFGDSTTGTTTRNAISHTYLNGGTYNVCLTITEYDSTQHALCTSTICSQVTVAGIPVGSSCHASIGYTLSTSIVNGVHFTNHSTPSNNTTVNYSWSFGDSTYSHLFDPTHAYANAGTYTACLTITSSTPNGGVCTSDTCIRVVVPQANPTPCHATYQYTATSAPLTLHFQEYATGTNLTYAWNFGDGTTGTGTDPTHTFTNAGTYNVCLTITSGAAGAVVCTDTYCDTITIGNPTGYCQASFSAILSSTAGNTVHFVNHSTGSTATLLTYLWTFGDGDTSHHFDPNHTYANAGGYLVCLTITETNSTGVVVCSSQYCDSVAVGNTNAAGPFSIIGQVYNGYRYLSQNAKVYLITLDSFDLIAVDSTLAPQGAYTFSNVRPGQYLIKAALTPSSPDYLNYVPTYYGDVLFWLNSTLLTITQGTASVDVHLQHGVNNGGPGFVGGNIFQGANKTGDPLGNYQIMVLNMDNTPVQYMYSDSLGKYNFTNLAYGTYQIYTEALGKVTYPAIVTIGPATEVHTEVGLIVNTDSVSYVRITGIENPESLISGSSLYPNPVTSSATVVFNVSKNAEVNITLTNILGQEMTNRKQSVTNGTNTLQLDMNGMAAGIYILNIKDNNNQGTIFRIVKQ